MNQQPNWTGPVGEQARFTRSLEQRLAAHPQLYQRVAAIVDIVEREIASGCTADEAEAKVRDQLRSLGQEVLQLWAGGTAEHATAQVLSGQAGVIKHRKKNSTGSPPSGRSQ